MVFQRRLLNAHNTFGYSFLEFYRNGDVLRIKYQFILFIDFIRPITITSYRTCVKLNLLSRITPSKSGLAFRIFFTAPKIARRPTAPKIFKA